MVKRHGGPMLFHGWWTHVLNKNNEKHGKKAEGLELLVVVVFYPKTSGRRVVILIFCYP